MNADDSGRLAPPHEIAAAVRHVVAMGLPGEAAWHVVEVQAQLLDFCQENRLLERGDDGSVAVTGFGRLIAEVLARFE